MIKHFYHRDTFNHYSAFYSFFSCNWNSRCKNDEEKNLLQKAVSQWGHLHAFQFLAGKFKFSQLFTGCSDSLIINISTKEIPLTTIHPFIPFFSWNWKSRCKNDEEKKLLQKAMSQWGHLHAFQWKMRLFARF